MKNNKKIIGLIIVSLLIVASIVGVIIIKNKKDTATKAQDEATIKATYSSLFDTLDKESFYFAASYVKTAYLLDNSYDSKENITNIYETRVKANLYSVKTEDGTLYVFDKNLDKNSKAVPCLSIAKDNIFFNFNINYPSETALNVFGVNAKSGTNDGFYSLSTKYKQNFYVAGSKVDSTLVCFSKSEITSFKDNTFLKSILLNQPTIKLQIELLSDSKNYSFEVDKGTKQIAQEMAWIVKNYDVLKDSLFSLSAGKS